MSVLSLVFATLQSFLPHTLAASSYKILLCLKKSSSSERLSGFSIEDLTFTRVGILCVLKDLVRGVALLREVLCIMRPCVVLFLHQRREVSYGILLLEMCCHNDEDGRIDLHTYCWRRALAFAIHLAIQINRNCSLNFKLFILSFFVHIASSVILRSSPPNQDSPASNQCKSSCSCIQCEKSACKIKYGARFCVATK